MRDPFPSNKLLSVRGIVIEGVCDVPRRGNKSLYSKLLMTRKIASRIRSLYAIAASHKMRRSITILFRLFLACQRISFSLILWLTINRFFGDVIQL